MFEREGLTASVTNTWAMEIEPGKRFLYELSRPGGRLFQVEIDLAAPVDIPRRRPGATRTENFKKTFRTPLWGPKELFLRAKPDLDRPRPVF